jgi:hypothetical protein
MNSSTFPSIWRFLGLVAVQGLLLKQMGMAVDSTYFNVLLYPLFILFLPMQMPAPYVVLLGTLIGATVDIFYGFPGVHASAGAFSGFMRSVVIGMFSPKGGFSPKELVFSPAHVSWPTFLRGAAVFFFLHLFWYFSVDAFSFVYFESIIGRTAASWGLTMIFVVLYGAMFNPKN